MARKVMLIDDLDGTPAFEKIAIPYKGAEYMLNLNEENAGRLHNAL